MIFNVQIYKEAFNLKIKNISVVLGVTFLRFQY